MQELEAYLLEFYQIDIKSEDMTFAQLFKEWVEYKRSFINVKNSSKSLSPSTIRRYERDYDKHLAGSELCNVPINSLSPIKLESYLLKIIDSTEIYEQAVSNLIGYVRQAFAYAYRAGYIRSDPAAAIDRSLILSHATANRVHTDEERILSHSEMKVLHAAVIDHETLYPHYAPDYAVELAMLTGMRVGEISALHWSDIDDEVIHIDFSEHRIDIKNKPSELVIDEPKNRKHRTFPLTPEISSLLAKIRAAAPYFPEGFVFSNKDGSRYTGHDISCAVSRRGLEAGIPNVSIHRIRRTVSSILRTYLPARTVAALLGHREETGTASYSYDVAEKSAKLEALEQLYSFVLTPNKR